MAVPMSKEAKLALIQENIAETLNPELIDEVLSKNETLRIYWGTATTGKILLADVHGFLDAGKAPIELVEFRAHYYRHCIVALLKAVNVPIDKLEFVLGSSYQLTSKYTMDVYRLASITTSTRAQHSGADVVKQAAAPAISSLLYPLLQALDEEYLGVHAQFGGVDQRKIFTLATELLPKAGYKSRAHLMNHIVPGLTGVKMSASDPNSKIDLLETPENVVKKIKKATCVPKVVEENGLIAFVEHVLLPASSLLDGERHFTVQRHDAEPLIYRDIEAVKKDYIADVLTPQLLKPAVSTALNRLLAPISAEFQASTDWQEVEKKAYPVEAPKEKKQKQKKDKGSRHPGAGAKPSEVQADEGKDLPTQATKEDVGASAADAMEKMSVN
ncbi:tyrosyl-tRNA synthetase [Penicillium lagena]|uniref:tyrosyl-tRNA synthetase n=1 Tax=Penicillium lagena TaxID=94218 RepID=UPI00254244E1|nr:tyrosyl-tRNA synthetase [Penicillium lagena]KAJ5625244.1 tyrosyl-tRNA synthetase [Penicillium lagena]